MEISLLNTPQTPNPAPEQESASELQKSLDTVATMLVAAGARIETLESHVAFLLSQNKQYMNLLKIAKKKNPQGSDDVQQEIGAE